MHFLRRGSPAATEAPCETSQDATPDARPDGAALPGPPMLGGLVNSATHSAAKPIQQDAAFHLALPGGKLVAVADGISGRAYLTRSQEASQMAVHAFLSYVIDVMYEEETISEEVIRSAFTYAHDMVCWLGSTTPDNPPLTTLVAAVETADSFYVAHVGDGGALVTTGDRGTRLNPLFSHANLFGALTQYLGMPRDTVTPGIISIPKVFDVGQLILISTDGLLPTGRGETLKTANLIVDEIQGYIESTTEDEHLEATHILEPWVAGLREPVGDNCALGLLISEATVRLWRGAGRDTFPPG